MKRSLCLELTHTVIEMLLSYLQHATITNLATGPLTYAVHVNEMKSSGQFEPMPEVQLTVDSSSSTGHS